jgi:hypothetical protein
LLIGALTIIATIVCKDLAGRSIGSPLIRDRPSILAHGSHGYRAWREDPDL